MGLAALVLAAGLVVHLFLALGCSSDHHGDYAHYCREQRQGTLLLWLVLLGPPTLTLAMGLVSVRRRSMMPVIAIGILLVPIVMIAPAFLWTSE
ncbi:MAG: hypothetical protein JWM60_1672 [Solirubrobacterales bacterium]|nr:hypothetical protein [Solirubrobacterales bacterium]